MTAPLVKVDDLAKTFDVSPPWLNRVLERKPRQFVHAVDGVSFSIHAARRWRWWANPAAARARWRGCWSGCTRRRAAGLLRRPGHGGAQDLAANLRGCAGACR
jgi:hypothetical protein